METTLENSIQARPHERTFEQVAHARAALKAQIQRRIVGQDDTIEQLLIGLMAGGHVLVVGVPGLAKTMIVKTFAEALALEFGRIQFTPDLMPTDITGTDVIEEANGKRQFRFVRGPIFCNLLLADEINRTPPKTQSALLEAMQERAVTTGGSTYELDRPFMVFATQNPIEQTGTYALPEAQLDRFMLQVEITYPNADEEVEIIQRTTIGDAAPVKAVLSQQQIIEIQKLVPQVPAARHVIEFAVRLVRQTRPAEQEASKEIRRFVAWGAGPRAAQMLVLAAQARALLSGRFAAETEAITALAPAVLRHRIVTRFEAEAEGVTADDLIAQLIAAIQ